MVKHKIDGALDQNTNSNQNFKTNQIRTQKKKKKKKQNWPIWASMGRGHVVLLLKCFGVDVVLEKKMRRKEKRKVKIRGKAPDKWR